MQLTITHALLHTPLYNGTVSLFQTF